MRTEVMRAIFGADKALSGEVYHKGKKLENRTPASVSEAGTVDFENRKEEACQDLDNADNIALASVKRYMRGGHQPQAAVRELGPNRVQGRPASQRSRIWATVSLSGGNAQKVILAKWLSTTADILILDEPTKGIDIGAKAEVYKLMEDIVEEGKSIIMVSSELMYVMNMSDRLIVMREGSIVAEMQRDTFSEDGIITRAVGGTVHA